MVDFNVIHSIPVQAEGIELKAPDERLGRARIGTIKKNLDRLLGSDWVNWELETISLELGMILDELTREKIHVIQILARKPDLFYDDPMFFLYASEVINNTVADFEFMPVPNSLELAFAISEVRAFTNSLIYEFIPFSNGVTLATAYILNEEGYSKPLEPFDFVPADMLAECQTPGDTADKEKAISEYIKSMEQ